MAGRTDEPRQQITRSSGNPFADLGFDNAADRQAKVALAVRINEVIERRRMSQARAAEQLGVNQPKISALRKYKLQGFSVERLLRFLTALDQDIEIVIRSKPRSRRAARVVVTAV